MGMILAAIIGYLANSVLGFKDFLSQMNKIHGAKRSHSGCGSRVTSPTNAESFHTSALISSAYWLFIGPPAASWSEQGCQDPALSSLEGRKSQGPKVFFMTLCLVFVLGWAASNNTSPYLSLDSYANT